MNSYTANYLAHDRVQRMIAQAERDRIVKAMRKRRAARKAHSRTTKAPGGVLVATAVTGRLALVDGT